MSRQFPLILTLDAHGVPHRWVTWQHACFYYAKDRVAWGLGGEAFRVYGGTRHDGNRSMISGTSIIAIAGKAMAAKKLNQVPPLSNHELFRRDHNLCGYCGDEFPAPRLTRDHIVPFSRGGRDNWMNVVTSCRWCNQKKGNRTLEEARLQLLYVPYVPNRAEYLILTNRRILADQMEFLRQHVSVVSRMRGAS
jgi:hypothetical protein